MLTEGFGAVGGGSTTASSVDGGDRYIPGKSASSSFQPPQLMGCPFFSKEITDPQGKNLTQGYP